MHPVRAGPSGGADRDAGRGGRRAAERNLAFLTATPEERDYSVISTLYNEHVFAGGGFLAPMAMSAVPKDKWPSACLHCHSCEQVCPQQIKISDMMASFAEKLEK